MLSEATDTEHRAVPNDRCLNFTPSLDQDGNCLSDVADLDQLQPFRNN